MTDREESTPPADDAVPQEAVFKAHVLKPATRASAVEALLGVEERDDAVEGTISPPAKCSTLVAFWERSSALGPNVAAMVTNVDSFGHRYEPAIDLDAPDADDRIRESLLLERLRAAERARRGEAAVEVENDGIDEPTTDTGVALPTPSERFDELAALDVPEPTQQEVAERKALLRRLARLELARLTSFFEICCPDTSFLTLRRQTRQDIEVTGNAYWELLRNAENLPSRFVRLPPDNVRATPRDEESTRVEDIARVADLAWERVPQRRFFRRYAQVKDGQVTTYFKEFGDPRLVSRKSGKVYKSVLAMRRAEGRDTLSATEIVHFKIDHPTSVYGMPRWIGNTPAVIGSRELDEGNLDHFANGAVPALAICVSGGGFKKNVVANLEDFFDQKVKGRGAGHRVVIIEAEPARAGGAFGPVPQIKFVPLRESQQQDASFQNYDERNIDKIGASFRMPRLLSGRDRAINRATSFASLQFAEDQVFAGERAPFDEFMNRKILPELGVVFWSFVTNAPTTHDPTTLSGTIAGLTEAGAISINEARMLAGGVFNRTYRPWPGRWANLPLPILAAVLGDPLAAQQIIAGALSSLRTTAEAVRADLAEQDAAAATASAAAQGSNGQGSAKQLAAPSHELPEIGGHDEPSS